MIKTFCITHKALQIPLPDDIPVIWLGQNEVDIKGRNQVFLLREISEELDAWHNFLGGSAGTFAIEKILSNRMIDWNSHDRVSITQYRKFMSKVPIGKMAQNYHPGMFSPTLKEVEHLDLHLVQKTIDTPFLLPQIVEIGNLLQHYASVHCVQDILRYTAIAVDLGVLSVEESVHFLNISHIIPGGIEFGIYPIDVFLNIIREIQIICFEFLKIHRPTDLNQYQRRALGFCNERLGSHLLFKKLKEKYNHEIPMDIFGYMHTVTDDGIYQGG